MELEKYHELFNEAWKFFKKYMTAPKSPELQEKAWKEINELYTKFNARTNDLADAILEATYNELDRLVFDPLQTVAVGRAS